MKIFVDDFEPCDALKTKRGLHKTTAYYMQINNLPSKYLSRLSSIHLVALCDASDSKNLYTNTNNVIESIVYDLKMLEENGIKTKSGITLKGTLMCTIFDNLGGNILYGLNASFNSKRWCRICIASKTECHCMTKENAKLVRNVKDYNACVEAAKNSTLGELSLSSNGIKDYCHLNDLKYFHIMVNFTVDLMHDILEGVASFAVKRLFKYIIDKKIATLDQIQHLIDCYHFGDLFKKNRPSKIKMEGKNLGQNASQMCCLVLHLPFAIFKFKDSLTDVWKPISTLLQILHIVYAKKITKSDIERLNSLVHDHLTSFGTCFNEHFRPKHHLLVHYARVIMAMGPVIFLSVMRMEAKHQYFKNIAQKTKNFINLKKSMANKHQDKVCLDGFTCSNELITGKLTSPFYCCKDYDQYENHLQTEFPDMTIEDLSVVNSVQLNGIKYKPNYLVQLESSFAQIDYIIMNENHFWVLCGSLYKVKRYDSFLNSLLLEKIEEKRILKLDDSIGYVYEKKYLKDKIFVIVENLSLYFMQNIN